ncbi:conjugal transfer protein TrbC [Aeromicrobium sp.]|uniref:conjugal transfer protein TrbC n=1 Tax=Aeromicrobium sp. TaxID=1871063 RepID=UPI0019A79DE0|nr:conjugal transfer protein TrbC [Aeromicrobium sp.]MBC7630547.1 hypothetical protein [Aeromicrobium sp.]
MYILTALPELLTTIATAVPDPGQGEAPPGSDGLVTILRWVFYIASAMCVLGVLIAGGMMAVSVQRGSGGEHVSRLGWALGGCIVIGAASALVGALL